MNKLFKVRILQQILPEDTLSIDLLYMRDGDKAKKLRLQVDGRDSFMVLPIRYLLENLL